jgi:hypothetical protein
MGAQFRSGSGIARRLKGKKEEEKGKVIRIRSWIQIRTSPDPDI